MNLEDYGMNVQLVWFTFTEYLEPSAIEHFKRKQEGIGYTFIGAGFKTVEQVWYIVFAKPIINSDEEDSANRCRLADIFGGLELPGQGRRRSYPG